MKIQAFQKRLSFGLRLFLALLAACPIVLLADEFRPALLELTESENGWVEVTWKVPAKGGKALAITPVLPDFMKPIGSGSGRKVPGAWVETTTFRTDGESLSGATVRVEGLAKVPTDVMLRVKLKDGGEHAAILRSGKESFTVPLEATKWEVAKSYTRMGTEHILEGYDHLLFLVALMLIVTGFWKLIKTITAFTVAHSITLALATLGAVNFPSAPTEAVISLSILFLAVEVLRMQAGEIPITAKYPWIVAFSFGLFHGLGFAGALSEIGVPKNEVPLALLMFNVGVETGQIMFVTVVAGLLALAHKLSQKANVTTPEWSRKLVPYAVGIIAAYWTIERTLSFIS
tara:strand:+ start:549 stop:1583 length:1035 start_codon:yes stop_codon:yes gene_type:complete